MQQENIPEQTILEQSNTPTCFGNEEKKEMVIEKEISELEVIFLSKSILIDIIGNLPVFKNNNTEEYEEENSHLTYMQKKLMQLQKETLNSFGSLGDMKKSYSRVQKEQMKIKENAEIDRQYRTDLRNLLMLISRTEKYYQLETNQDSFDDCFINKKESQMLGRKRFASNNENDSGLTNHTGYTPIKRKKIQQTYEDFGSFMAKAIKNKPIIQIQKEKFIEEQNEKRKKLLQARNVRNDVLKFDSKFN